MSVLSGQWDAKPMATFPACADSHCIHPRRDGQAKFTWPPLMGWSNIAERNQHAVATPNCQLRSPNFLHVMILMWVLVVVQQVRGQCRNTIKWVWAWVAPFWVLVQLITSRLTKSGVHSLSSLSLLLQVACWYSGHFVLIYIDPAVRVECSLSVIWSIGTSSDSIMSYCNVIVHRQNDCQMYSNDAVYAVLSTVCNVLQCAVFYCRTFVLFCTVLLSLESSLCTLFGRRHGYCSYWELYIAEILQTKFYWLLYVVMMQNL